MRSGRDSVCRQVIVGGAQEELSLQQLMEEVNQEVIHAAAQADEDIDAEDLTRQVHMKLKSRGGFIHTSAVQINQINNININYINMYKIVILYISVFFSMD